MEGKYSKHSRKKMTKLREKEGRGRVIGEGRGGGKKKGRNNEEKREIKKISS